MISKQSITAAAISHGRGHDRGKCSSVPEHKFTDPVSRDTRSRIANITLHWTERLSALELSDLVTRDRIGPFEKFREES